MEFVLLFDGIWNCYKRTIEFLGQIPLFKLNDFFVLPSIHGHVHVFANSFIVHESCKLSAIGCQNPLRYLRLSPFYLKITV